MFDVYVPGGGNREVWVSRVLDGNNDPQTFDLEFQYRVTPRVDEGKTVLRCDRTFLSPSDAPSVNEFTYVLNPPCMDLDMNQRVELDDAVLWTDSPVDVDRNGTVDLADLATLLEHVQ